TGGWGIRFMMANAGAALSSVQWIEFPRAYFRRLERCFVRTMPLARGRRLSLRERGRSMSMPVENQIRNLRVAFENGKLTRDLYAKNLLRLLGLAEHPTAQKVAAAFMVGPIDQALLARNLGTRREARAAPAPEPA